MRALASFADILANGKPSVFMKMHPTEEKMLQDALSPISAGPFAPGGRAAEPQSQYTTEELMQTETKAEPPKRQRASRAKNETPVESEAATTADSEEAETATTEAVDPIAENDDTNANEEPEVTKDMVRIRFGEKAKADQEVKTKVQTWIKSKGADKLDSLGKEHLPALLKYINSL